MISQSICLRLQYLGMALIAMTLSSCASSSVYRRHQYVYITSEPAGATIFDKNEAIGITPGLIHMHRQSDYELKLQIKNEIQPLQLSTKYRWLESFTYNLIFGGLAPVGWLVDGLTGAAWDFQDPKIVKFSNKIGRPQEAESLAIIAVAPPIADTAKLSDEAAEFWIKRLPQVYPDAQILDYQKTFPEFQNVGFEFDTQNDNEQDQRHLLMNLKANQSQCERNQHRRQLQRGLVGSRK